MSATKIDPVSVAQSRALNRILHHEDAVTLHVEQSLGTGEIRIVGQDADDPESLWMAHISSTGEVGWTVG